MLCEFNVAPENGEQNVAKLDYSRWHLREVKVQMD